MFKNKPQKDTQKKQDWRRLVIETNGNQIKITESQVASALEMKAILVSILEDLQRGRLLFK